jgi:phage/plasmid-like protein (TIGR03299 family)
MILAALFIFIYKRRITNMLIKLDNVKSAEEALLRSGLDWSVEQTPVMTGNGLTIDSHKALFRSDTQGILGVVGSDYAPIQNVTAFAFFDVICEKHNANYEYAGIIKEGKKIFLQAKLGKSFDAVPGDKVDCFVTMVTSHDGSSSLKAFLTPIRLFCQNQLIRAIKAATTNIALRHTSNVEERIQDAFKVFSMSSNAFDCFKTKAKYLAHRMVDRRMVENFLKEVIADTDSTRAKNQREKVLELFEHGRGNTGKTAWHLYNAACEYVDHDRTSDPEKALDSAMFGSGSALKELAFEKSLAL